MSDLLSRDQLLAKVELPSAFVSTPEWGGRVKVRRHTAEERDAFDAETREIEQAGRSPMVNFRGRFVAWTVCDDEGSLLFVSRDGKGLLKCDPAASVALGAKGSVDLQRVYRASADLNGLGEDDDVTDDLEGN